MSNNKKQYFIKMLLTLITIAALLSASFTATAETYELTAEVEKDQYLQGEMVNITARLTEDGVGVAGGFVCFEIKDPLGVIIPGICGITNDTGYIIFTHMLDPDAPFGTYDVNVTAHDYQLETHAYFEVVSEFDTTDPTVEITKPKVALYLFNNEIIPFFTTLIIGSIDIEVGATDAESGIDKVEFYIDDELVHTDSSEPYIYAWSETAFLSHTIKAKAYDNAGNNASAEINVLKFF